MMWRSQYGAAAVLSTLVCGCGPTASGAGSSSVSGGSGIVKATGGIRVVAVERVYGDLAAQIGGEAVTVDTLLNSATADPHSYEPATHDADLVAAADIVIENGLGYDAFADKLIAASPKSGRMVIVVGALSGHKAGDNPHVWYEAATLRMFTIAFASELDRRKKAPHAVAAEARQRVLSWVARFDSRLRAIAKGHAGEKVAITEPVFDYVLRAANLTIATPPSFSHAIEEGNDPAPQDVDAMRALLASRTVRAFVYNGQTIEPSTESLLATARSAGTRVVPVTETLPAGETTERWIDGEVAALELAL